MTTYAERFWAKTTRLENGCLMWTGTRYRNGYGMFTICDPTTKLGKKVLAHRTAFQLAVRALAPGERVDHTCHNNSDCLGGWGCLHRLCVEPSHLEGTTQRQNLLRSPLTLPAQYAARTRCSKGHEYTEENTFMYRGGRRCRACNRDAQQAWRDRQQH